MQKMAKRRKNKAGKMKVSMRELLVPERKDTLLRTLMAIVVITLVVGSALYLWYDSKQLPRAVSEDDFKNAVTACVPSRFDLTQSWGSLRLETRYCNTIDVRVSDYGDYTALKGMAMRCRPTPDELKSIPLSLLPSHLDLCEGELKRSEIYQGIIAQ